MSEARQVKELKFLVVGDKSVGKTTLILSYLQGAFAMTNQVLRGVNLFRQTINTDGGDVVVNIWDIAGEERFREVVPALTNFVSGVVLTFDGSAAESLVRLQEWMVIIDHYIPKSAPRLLVSLKQEETSSIQTSEVFNFVMRHEIKDYIPVSAKTGQNVQKVFERLIAYCKAREKRE